MLGLKLLGIHAIISLVQFLFMPAFFGIWQDNIIYQWVIGLLFIALFWLVIYADVSSRGSEDFRRGAFEYTKGFLAGIIASIPLLVIYFAGLIYGYSDVSINWFVTFLRIWLVPYTIVFSSFDDMILWIMPVTILMFPIVTGLSYMDGKRKRLRVNAVIEKAKALRIEKSKVSSQKNNK